ncbi:PD-(D/E)XK motif protein [Ferrimicrobium sp.]|uniref:PD-(D/E)XK motif protein n=1 Tax=Ferrimicrobium sp. TaxID=2926050 RepID=UPI0026123465|nr:PD-(D/E)XK motif protein [Ferrimicrobium sp.]
MNPDQLEHAWQSLATPDSMVHLNAVPIFAHDAWAAIDHEGLRHLLLLVPDGTVAPPTVTRGLRMTVVRHQVEGGEPADYLDLVCLSDDLAPTFTAVAADIGNEVGTALAEERVAAVISALGRWQWFWGVETDRLSEQDALGLFAELWFLHRWEGGVAGAVEAWTASTGSRHDFQWRKRSVEVKATSRRADGAVLHRIQHLDQLADPEEGDLYLFSLRVVRDELAHNTLPNIVDRITEGLRGNAQAKDDLACKLGQRGYSPAFRRRHETPYRILGEHMYRVGPGFPRLTVNSFVGGLQPGIADVSYVIDMAPCDDWLIATSPDGWEPI